MPRIKINNPGSNLGYLAPQDNFFGCQIVRWDPLNAKLMCPQKKIGTGYVKMLVSMATHSGFENGGMHAYRSTHILAFTYPRLLNLIQKH